MLLNLDLLFRKPIGCNEVNRAGLAGRTRMENHHRAGPHTRRSAGPGASAASLCSRKFLWEVGGKKRLRYAESLREVAWEHGWPCCYFHILWWRTRAEEAIPCTMRCGIKQCVKCPIRLNFVLPPVEIQEWGTQWIEKKHKPRQVWPCWRRLWVLHWLLWWLILLLICQL